MAKLLRQQPPSSSVAHLLDFSAAARAVSTPGEEREGQTPENEPSTQITKRVSRREAVLGEQPNVKRELVLTASTDDAFSRLVDLYRKTTGTRLTASHVARAMLRSVAHSMDQVEREAKRLGRLKLPSNARGNEAERERFEAKIADAFLAGMRSAAAFDPEE